ncbi:CCT motif family protein [Trifolium repens]|nr:CCT motif family protein [Trifolium repens]
MNAYSNSNNIIPFSTPFLNLPSPSPSPLIVQQDHSITEFDSLHDTLSQLNNSELSSGYSSYGGSPSPSTPISLMQRSISSHSLHHNNGTHHHPFSAFFAELLESEDTPVRKVCSTGDLQRINGMQHNHHHVDSPLSSESSMIIEGMSRVCPYSPEEKKVRIERYRTKRNQRNFNKKIKYVCRKTLADRRPRIRGRFARNDEIDKTAKVEWSHIGGGEEEDEEDENWINIFDSIVAANLVHDEFEGSSSFGLLY